MGRWEELVAEMIGELGIECFPELIITSSVFFSHSLFSEVGEETWFE
jgi:hypothetical protein